MSRNRAPQQLPSRGPSAAPAKAAAIAPAPASRRRVANLTTTSPREPPCACGGTCPRCAAPVAHAGAPAEVRATRLAAQMMQGAPQTPALQAAEPVRHGTPLPPELRAFYEPRFGASLTGIGLHTGPHAARAARALGAHAFTYERQVWLGGGRPALPSLTMAHELAHAVHDDPHTVWREPYETRGIDLDTPASTSGTGNAIPSGRERVATLAGRSYWEQRTLDRYALTMDTSLSGDGELQDAVLSVLWSLNPPATVRSRQVMLVPIDARTMPAPAAVPGAPTPSATQTPQILCRFTFSPPAARGGKPQLEVMRLVSGTGMTALAAPSAPSGFTPAGPNSLSFSGFATTSDDYFAAHPEEHQALFHWIENSAPASFSQLVTTHTQVPVQRGSSTMRVTHSSAFHVAGSHSGSTISTLTLVLIGESDPLNLQSAPTDYRGHGTGMDFEVEKLQGRTTDALGTVTLPSGLPADERAPVQEAVRQYFSAGHARNTEVDAVVPVGSGSRSVLFTLRFGAANAVTVERIGEAGSTGGLIDVKRLDVRRVRDFPASANAAGLRSWWRARYPQAGALAATATATEGELITEMNDLLAAGIAAASWFDHNYGIEVLDAAGTTARLRATHNAPAAMAAGTVDFDSTDLRMLELSLQTLTASEITRLRGLKLGRRTSAIRRSGSTFAAGGANQYGLTLTEANGEATVLYFAPLYANNTRLFRGGGAASALPEVTMGLLHELGHATGHRAGIEAAFTAWLTSNPQAAPTWYAASATAEMFPEVWALYHSDPHFLCSSAPLLYAWLDVLATTGTPPVAAAALTPPTSCPP